MQTAAIGESADPAYINVVYLADGKVNVTSSSRAASLMAVEESQVEPQEERGKLTTYVYDGLGRLKSETIVDSGDTDVISYTYDAAGNRATMTRNGIVTTYTYDANNRMTAEQTGTNVKTFLYDANGNQLSALFNFNFAGAYTYDLFGRQISYTPDEVGFTYYTYRPDDLRHSIGNTVHAWSGTDIVTDIKGGTTTVYFRGIGLIFAETSGTRTYYHQNAHGDVIMLTDGTGTILTTYEYDAFGREWDALDSDNNPFRYCGEYFDKQTKTIYLRARYYDSAYGRFTQQDGWQYADVNDPLSLNLYTYCWNNPVNMVDPDGHSAVIATLLKAAAGGATDFLAQLACNYFLNPNTKFDISASLDAVNWWQVGRSAIEAALPWNIPGGVWGKAAFTATGDVIVNALTYGNNYSVEQAITDFAVGFFGSLASSALESIINQFGKDAVEDSLNNLTNPGVPFDPNGGDLQIGVDPNTLIPTKDLDTLDPKRLKTVAQTGQNQSVKVYQNGVIYDGHHRVANAIKSQSAIDVEINYKYNYKFKR